MDSSFRVVLCSENPELFKTIFSPPLNFPPHEIWKVSLQEISFPSCLNNFEEEEITLHSRNKVFKLFLPAGYYRDIKSLHRSIFEIWRELPKKHFFFPKISSDKKRIRFRLIWQRRQKIIFSPRLAWILDLPPVLTRTRFSGNARFESPYETKYINVFSDIVEENLVGEHLTSLITSIACRETNPGGLTSFCPPLPEYLTVKPGIHNSIRIELKRMDSKPLRFSAKHILLKFKFIRI